VLSTHPLPKISPISADKSWDNFSVLYALAYMDSSPLRLYDFALTTYHGDIESRMLQIRTIIETTRTQV